MKKLTVSCLVVLNLALFSLAALSALAAESELPGMEAIEQMAGRKVQKVDGAGSLYYVFMYEDDAQKNGVPYGLYLYGTNGAFNGIAYYDQSMGSMGRPPVLSPDSKILAVDAGETAGWRTWYFYSFPGLKRLEFKPLEYFVTAGPVSLLWHGENVVYIHEQLENTAGRTCHYEDCGPVSIARYSLVDGSLTTVLEGSPLCDYRLESIKEKTLKARKICLERLEDWKDFPVDAPGEIVQLQLQ